MTNIKTIRIEQKEANLDEIDSIRLKKRFALTAVILYS